MSERKEKKLCQQLLKIMSMNHYDLEENSRMELLVEFKVSYGNALRTVGAMLEKFRTDMDEKKERRLCILSFRLCSVSIRTQW